ncbi:MAG: TolC family protein [Bryobacterales bacterium]|nr:TolC family protein [Bryobacterales bacterium]
MKLALCLLLSVFAAFAQQQLKGIVESVNTSTRKVAVANEPIPGGMAAMTMSYSVDKPDILTKLTPGDRIIAKFDDATLTLSDIQIVTPPPSAPKATTTLNLEELERLALTGNPNAAIAEANVRVAAGNLRQSGLYPNPTAGYYGDEIRGGRYRGGKQGGFIAQTIVTGGKLGAARRVAELLRDQQQTTAEIQKLRIRMSVRILFYQVLAAQRLVDVRQNLASIAADATQTSHQLANIGQADRPDVLQAEVEQQRADVGVRTEQQNLLAAWKSLAAVVGQPNLPLTRLEGDLEAFPDLTFDQSLAKTLQESPEVKLARQSIERTEASVIQERRNPVPDLEIQANLTKNNEPIEGTSRAIGLNGGVQVGVQLPIFNRNQGAIAAARAGVETSKAELTRLQFQISRDLATLFRDYQASRITARQYKDEMLPRAQQAYKMYQATYQKMQSAWPQTLLSQRTLFQLEVDYVAALEATWTAALQIQTYALTPLP